MNPEGCVKLDRQFFLQALLRGVFIGHANSFRDLVSHPDPLNEGGVRYSAQIAIACSNVMGDRIRAIEVESLVEAFSTKTSQSDALLYLYNASWDD